MIMKQVTLNVKDGKFQFFLELIKSLDFVQLEGNYTIIEKKDLKNRLSL